MAAVGADCRFVRQLGLPSTQAERPLQHSLIVTFEISVQTQCACNLLFSADAES